MATTTMGSKGPINSKDRMNRSMYYWIIGGIIIFVIILFYALKPRNNVSNTNTGDNTRMTAPTDGTSTDQKNSGAPDNTRPSDERGSTPPNSNPNQ